MSSAGAAESAAVSSSLSPHAISRLAARTGKINFIISPHMKFLKSGRLLTGLPAAFFCLVSIVILVLASAAALVSLLLRWLKIPKERGEL